MTETESQQPRFLSGLERQLDSDLRVVLPKEWRSLKITDFVLTTDSSKSFISAIPTFVFDRYIAKIESNTALDDDETERGNYLEVIGSTCVPAQLDNAGRLKLPFELCNEIGISDEEPVMLRGAVRTFRIWNMSKLQKSEAKRDKLRTTPAAPVNTASAKKFLGL